MNKSHMSLSPWSNSKFQTRINFNSIDNLLKEQIQNTTIQDSKYQNTQKKHLQCRIVYCQTLKKHQTKIQNKNQSKFGNNKYCRSALHNSIENVKQYQSIKPHSQARIIKLKSQQFTMNDYLMKKIKQNIGNQTNRQFSILRKGKCKKDAKAIEREIKDKQAYLNLQFWKKGSKNALKLPIIKMKVLQDI